MPTGARTLDDGGGVSMNPDVQEMRVWILETRRRHKRPMFQDAMRLFGEDIDSWCRALAAIRDKTFSCFHDVVGCAPNGRAALPRAVKRDVLSVGRCAKCGATENLSVDHIIAFAQGGTNARSNLQCLCLSCNQRKGSHG